MPDEMEEVETYHPGSSIMNLIRRIPFLIGVGVMIWLILAKNMPSLLPNPNSKPVTMGSATHKTQEPGVPIHTDNNAVVTPQPSDADKEHIAQLQNQVSRLSDELAALKAQMSEHSDGLKKDDQLLEDKLARQEKTMQAMKARMDALQESNTDQLTALTAFSIMKEASVRGEPFDNELKQMSGLIHDPEKLALLSQLKPFASDGIKTTEALQSQFEKLVPDALSPGHKADSLAHNLQSLIRIRKEGDPAGTDDESILARAETKINRGEIAGGLKEMQPLSPPVADVFADWSKNARSYINGRNAFNALQIALLNNQPSLPIKPAPVASLAPQLKPVEKITEKPATETPPLIDDNASDQDADDTLVDSKPGPAKQPDTSSKQRVPEPEPQETDSE